METPADPTAAHNSDAAKRSQGNSGTGRHGKQCSAQRQAVTNLATPRVFARHFQKACMRRIKTPAQPGSQSATGPPRLLTEQVRPARI